MIEQDAFHPGCTEEFSELCALSTCGALTAQEHDRLQSHLKHCAGCRELLGQYRDLIERGLPLIASQQSSPQSASVSSWNAREAKNLLLARMDMDEDLAPIESIAPRAFLH